MAIARLDEGMVVERELDPGRGCWVQVVIVIIGLNGTEMREGDGAAPTSGTTLSIEAGSTAKC